LKTASSERFLGNPSVAGRPMTSVIVVGKTVKEMQPDEAADGRIRILQLYQSREDERETYSSVDTKDIDCVT
jgi:hypothetical protein